MWILLKSPVCVTPKQSGSDWRGRGSSLKPFLYSISYILFAHSLSTGYCKKFFETLWWNLDLPQNTAGGNHWAKANSTKVIKIQGNEVSSCHLNESVISEESPGETQHFDSGPSPFVTQNQTFIYWVLEKCHFLCQVCAVERAGYLSSPRKTVLTS